MFKTLGTEIKCMSKYAIFKNNKGQSLVYYPCAKNANSSAKLFFIKHIAKDEKVFFIDDEVPRHRAKLYLQTAKKHKNRVNLITIFPAYEKFSKINSDFKCCIIRNPIKRFISAYKNRILYHKDKAFSNFSIEIILEKLLEKNFENKHFLPQYYFLGNELKYYSFYSDVSKIELFEQKVNEFFEKKIKFPKIQIGGNNIEISLTKKQILLIEKIYSMDFELYNSRK